MGKQVAITVNFNRNYELHLSQGFERWGTSIPKRSFRFHSIKE